MRYLVQILTGLVFFVVGALILMHFMPGSASLARSIGVPESVIELVAREEPDAQPAQSNSRRRNQGPLVVVVEPAGEGRVNDRLSALGDGDAIRSVAVTPFVSGQIAEVMVNAGDRVKQGQVVARLDDEVEKIALDRAKVDLKSAETTLTRNRDLKKIVSGADLQIAETAVDTARLAVAGAQVNLERRLIRSPIDGVAGIVNITQGDYVTSATQIVTVDDRSRLLVDFWAPERFAGLVEEGQEVSAQPISRPGKSYTGKIAAIDNRIDPASRTIHLRAEIANDGDELRAGQSFDVTLALGGDRWPSVNPLSVQWDSQGSFVWRFKDGKVERVAAAVIERNPDRVLVDAKLAAGDMIVTEGLQRLRNGAEVQIYGEKKPDADKVADAAPAVKP
ncbi:efflux RND transporter periplasmic adaptor subunit [Rhizobium sp. TRM95796]|uniref:efflux RND transporter periplasmic adaptor subunit n=1 Tax=Rhizobium sp. TRM95796 TaxID=2979862 RepID=UPI0021E93104|nr:efflux RND transporter periplasmic adaptor subunit [Rhizobium sp. TRM95796]MCV3764552.1 efflux RND transporter periplasmic adaptor subunit [Rhizobium sp. TRM95796]